MAKLRPAKSFEYWRIGNLFRYKGGTSSLPASPSSLEPKPMLCIICHMLLTSPECQKIAREDPEFKYWTTRAHRILHQPSLGSLFTSVYQGCYICSAILNVVVGARSLQEVEAQYAERLFETLWDFDGIDGEFLHVTLAGRHTYILNMPLVTFRRIPRPGTIRYTPLSPDLDQSIKSLITGWLTSCQRNHSCRPPACKWMPTRLLAIQRDRPDIKLVCFDNDAPARPYATLSHVWGEHKHTVLETSNFEMFKSSVPSDALPKCFQQAVFVARLLGIEYVWIDSLCILQDSTEDWNREAALMASIYGNSTINVAMSFVSRSSEGCFNARKLELLRVPTVKYIGNYVPFYHSSAPDEDPHHEGSHQRDLSDEDLDDEYTSEEGSRDGYPYNRAPHDEEPPDTNALGEGSKDEISEDEVLPEAIPKEPQLVGFVLDQSWWAVHPSSGPLESRAWVLQERLLSPRILHLTNEQAFWECLEVGCCETFPDGVPLNYMSQERRLIKDAFQPHSPYVRILDSNLSHRQYLHGIMSDSYKPSQGDFLNSEFDSQWKYLVKEFCRRKLTFNKDKLVALSGIASVLRAQTGDRYLAGLWQSTLPRSLLWTAHSVLKQATPGPYRAPSWSWASVDADMVDLHSYEETIMPSAEPTEPLVHVISVDMKYASDNDMVEPVSAVLHLRGCLYTVLSPEEVQKGMGLADLPLHERLIWKMYYKFDVRAKNGNIFHMQDRIDIDPARGGVMDPSDADALFEQRVFLLPILKGHLSLSSLILVRQEDGLYRRIGAVFVDTGYGDYLARDGLRFDMLDRERQNDWDQISII